MLFDINDTEKQRLYNLRWKFKKGQQLLAEQGGTKL